MERSTLDLWVGLFVCAGIGALLILAMKVGNMASIGIGSDTYTIYGNFDNIGGLKPRAGVKSAGVVVGRVTSIVFDNERFNARVAMAIENKYKFPKDTTASILTSGLLGEQYIGLDAGGDSNNLAAGETRANQVTVTLPADRKIYLANNVGTVHLVADVAGYYTTGSASRFTTNGLSTARHWWRVRAIDAEGGAGPWSAVRSFRPQPASTSGR